MIRKTKRDWVDQNIKEIEEERKGRNTKIYYRKINEQSRTYKGTTKNIKNKNGKIIEEEKEYIKVWEDHFKELLTDPNLNIEDEIEEQEEENSLEEPTKQEIKEIIANTRNGKAPGKDNINMELIKHAGDSLHDIIYQIKVKIWREEKMPEEWEMGQIVTIHKKGDQQDCQNYRGITILNSAYKLLSTLIQKKLSTNARRSIGQYQCGFVKGRSAVDAIHTLKQIMEKAHEHQINLEMLFVDFRQAFDTIHRGKLMKALKELEVNVKLRRLIRMTMQNTRATILTQKGESDQININRGVRQGDALSATLFNLSLEYVMRKVQKGNLRSGGQQIIAYADDIVIITKSRKILEDALQEIAVEGKKTGLQINENKTKIMIYGKKGKSSTVKIGSFEFEKVEKFKYLGVTITSTGDRRKEIEEKIISTNRAYHANKKLLKSKILSKQTKLNIYKVLIRPIMMYAAETMILSKKDEEDLRIIERKIMRSILGPVKIGDNEYRSRMNYEIEQEMKGENIIKSIKRQRMKWLGHIYRADQQAITAQMTQWQPGGRRRRGRPRLKWLEQVVEDMTRAGIKNWKEKAMDRKLWKNLTAKL